MVRALIAAATLLLLTACGRGDPAGPFAETKAPPALSSRFYPPENWAWGFIQTGDKPPQRYGVGAGWRAPRATVLILPGYGESAEAWFETASTLIARGYNVWVLDRAGQGGSGRYTLPRDLGHVPSFDPDVANVRALVRVVIRPSRTTPLILLGSADGAVVALRAVQTGLDVDGLILSSPALAPKQVDTATAQALAGRAGLGRLPSTDWKPWSRQQPDARVAGLTHDVWRGRVQMAWQTANPDLRMAGSSLGWRGAHQAASRAAENQVSKVPIKVLILAPGDSGVEPLCTSLPTCLLIALPGARAALHLELDRYREPWLRSVTDFVAAQVEAERAAEVTPRPSPNAPVRPQTGSQAPPAP